MDCSCVYVDMDYFAPEFFVSKDRKARKAHTCCECGATINTGDNYRVESGKWEGVFNYYKTCSACIEIRDKFFCEGYYFEMLMELLNNHIQEIDGDVSASCLSILSPNAREKVCELIEACWE